MIDTTQEAAPAPVSRRRRYVAAALGLVVAAGIVALLSVPTHAWRDGSRHGRWIARFDGFGVITASGSGSAQAITLQPQPEHGKRDTHSALVVTDNKFGNFAATVRIQTRAQLRRGAAGSPNPWEVGWVVWHYRSNTEFYALTLEPSGWVLSKQDPAYPGGQRFLATGKIPRFAVGRGHTAGIVQIGNQITVSADGRMLTRFVDTQRPYLRGSFGLYTEDSRATFDHISIATLPDSH